MSFQDRSIAARKFVLTGEGGSKDPIGVTRVLTAGIFGTHLFIVQPESNTAVVFDFDLKPLIGDVTKEPAVTADEFYALREEVHEIQKSQARQALGTGPDGEQRRGPGRPSNAERAALTGKA